MKITPTFSQESSHLTRSIMRELIQRTAQPNMITLSGGLPASELLPTKILQDCMIEVLSEEGGDALQYRPMHAPLVDQIVSMMRARGVDCDADQVFITNGNQQGLTILSRVFLDPGAVAVTEAVTYTGIQQVTAGRGCIVRTVPTDLATGVDVEALEAAFSQSPRPQLAIVISEFHNPLGVSISQEKRQQVAELAAAYGVSLVEDDPYSALRFNGEQSKPIKAYDSGDNVFYLGTFSKMLAPSLRLGWMVAPRDLIPRLTPLRESIDLESSAFTQRVVARFLDKGALPAHLAQLNAVNKERCDVMIDALTRHLGDRATWTQPDGGMFVWLTLNDSSIDTWAMFEDALTEKVAYVPGRAFAVNGGYDNTMRLNFSKVTPENIEEGVQRLARVIERTAG